MNITLKMQLRNNWRFLTKQINFPLLRNLYILLLQKQKKQVRFPCLSKRALNDAYLSTLIGAIIPRDGAKIILYGHATKTWSSNCPFYTKVLSSVFLHWIEISCFEDALYTTTIMCDFPMLSSNQVS